MKYVIFYSWQSDLPNNTNRSFIESVIEKAIKNSNRADLYDLEPTIDRDTKDVPGAPNITQTLIDKIKASDAFVADISIVTGILNEDERPSPNPNVLLELGYAIALLGWGKIVLFCNEHYGTDEDLPFDIRQHRRIGYHLEQDEPKSDVRNDLAKHFGSRLSELLKRGKAPSTIKSPVLGVLWNYLNFENTADIESGIDSCEITLKRATDNTEVKERIQQEITLVNETDGSIDPKWDDKKESFIKRAEGFIEELSDEQKGNDFLVNRNVKNVCPVTLTVDNDGTASASDIRVEVELPEWILGVEKLPKERDVLTRPNMPIPTAPKLTDAIRDASIFGDISSMDLNLDHAALLRANMNRNSACYLKNERTVYFWADRLLHKHVITNRSDRLYLLALSNAPVGTHKISGQVFCTEQDDWHDIELSINVV